METYPPAKLYSVPTKPEVGNELCKQIIQISSTAIEARGAFSIALSGGSLPALLSKLPQAYKDADVAPHFAQWHILLADERGVPEDHPDSNMHALKKHLFDQVGVDVNPKHLYRMDQISLAENIEVAALEYENQVRGALQFTGDSLDLALLGFGPDGHTCSLFPGHPLLKETTRMVASLTDSPKHPPRRMTLTLRVLNDCTRTVIFCGAGRSKQPILEKVFVATESQDSSPIAIGIQNNPPPFPCAMVVPQSELIWIIDDAAKPAFLGHKAEDPPVASASTEDPPGASASS